jgi:type IVB pilus formation R64 PilN family outer membrane protein
MKHKKIAVRLTAAFTATSLLTACGASQEARTSAAAMANRMAAMESTLPKATDSTNKRHIVFKDGAYLGNKMVAVSSEKLLPPVFSNPLKTPVKFVSDEGSVNLPKLAEIITKYTGIPVDINQNIYVKSASVPAAGKGSSAGRGSDAVANNAFESERNISLDYKGSLASYLDMVVAKLGVSWEYDAGRIHFFRYKSKSFEVKGMLDHFETESSMSSAGEMSSQNGQNGSNAGVATRSKSKRDVDYFKELTAQVSAKLSNGGSVTPNTASNTLVVTDTPQVLREVGLFVEDMNRRASRVAYFNVALYRVSDNWNDQAGINWQALLSGSKYRLISSAGTNLVTEPGGIGIFRLAPTASVPTTSLPGVIGDGLSGGQGSNLLLQAMRQLSGVTEEWHDNGYTINNRPLPFSTSTTKEYVAETGTTITNAAAVTTIKQKEYSYGVNIQLTPHIYDNNSMMLDIVVDVTDGVPLDVTLVNGTVVRSKTVPQRATRQTLVVRPGEQIVLAKLGRNQNAGREALGLTGYSTNADRQKENMLLVITPVLWRAS